MSKVALELINQATRVRHLEKKDIFSVVKDTFDVSLSFIIIILLPIYTHAVYYSKLF